MRPYPNGFRFHLPLVVPYLGTVTVLFLITIATALVDNSEHATPTSVVELIAIGAAIGCCLLAGWHFGIRKYNESDSFEHSPRLRLYATKAPRLRFFHWLWETLFIYSMVFTANFALSYLFGKSDLANAICVFMVILTGIGAALYDGARMGWRAADNYAIWD